MKNLKVSEIFKGIQGEGLHSGRSAVFVRFAGCNLKCKFCDTKYARNEVGVSYWPPEELVDAVIELAEDCNFIVITGGEPTIQDASSLKFFLRLLKDNRFYIAMETNGTISFDRDTFLVDWLTVSPKNDFFIQAGEELKVLVDSQFKEEDLKQYEKCNYKHFYLQPILPDEFGLHLPLQTVQEYYDCVEDLVRDHPKWKMSFQLHKLMGWR